MDPILEISRREAEAASRCMCNAYEARRKWTKTDTARWLNERSLRVLAWTQRRELPVPTRTSRQMGYWLKDNQPPIFARAHARLTGLTSDQEREAIFIEEVLR